jgi:hypothetical protein
MEIVGCNVITDAQLEGYYGLLNVPTHATVEQLRRVYMQKSYALIKRGASEVERAALKEAYDAVVAMAEQRAASVAANAAPVEVVPKPVGGNKDVRS